MIADGMNVTFILIAPATAIISLFLNTITWKEVLREDVSVHCSVFRYPQMVQQKSPPRPPPPPPRQSHNP